MTAFHLAFFVADLASTRQFYGDVLGCREGRSTDTWVDFDFFGHQISAHTTGKVVATVDAGVVDGIKVPMPHFGACWDGMNSPGWPGGSVKRHPVHPRASGPLRRPTR